MCINCFYWNSQIGRKELNQYWQMWLWSNLLWNSTQSTSRTFARFCKQCRLFVTKGSSNKSMFWFWFQTIHITFESHDVLDASHPTCDLHFNETYIAPQTHLLNRKGIYSPLPSCSTADSREGANMTYFWFFLLELTKC